MKGAREQKESKQGATASEIVCSIRTLHSPLTAGVTEVCASVRDESFVCLSVVFGFASAISSFLVSLKL